jgi:uncharacterized protein
MIQRLILLVLPVCLLLGSLLARAAASIPLPPARWVTDNAGFLSPETRRSLDQTLERYERETGHQVIVWIDKTIGTESLDEWAVRTFEAWRLGRKGIDDGLAVFILAEDRKIAIEVGYGLEDRVPDAVASRIIQDVMLPRIRTGEHDQAVTAAIGVLLSTIEGRPFEIGKDTAPPVPKPHPWVGTAKLILIGAGALLLLILFITNPSLALSLLYVIMSGRGGRGMGGGGGGFHGGGGRSGGGGARGSW